MFADDELASLEDALAATLATGELSGRARVRAQWERAISRAAARRRFDEADKPPSVMTPERALAYFRSLHPTIGVDPQRWGPLLRRRAFTLAVDTEGVVLKKVKDVIVNRIETGKGIAGTPAEIDDILEAAGIHPRNPQYAEMVFRTNYMDAATSGVDEEKADPDVAEYFPAWRYSNPSDSRSRPEHAARNGQYYPASMSFQSVRGTDPADVINCRCDQVLIDKFEWAELQARGARFAV